MPGDLSRSAVFWSSYWPSFAVATLGFSLRATGRHHLPVTGPVLIVANHQSFVDPWLIGQSVPRPIRYLARDSLFKSRVLGPVIRAYGAVPIDRGFGKEGLQTVLTLLREGQAVLAFAEGERTHTGALQPLRPGVALLIKKIACPVVPAGIVGAYDLWPRDQKWPSPEMLFRPARGKGVSIAFGRPLDSARLAAMPRDEMLEELRGAIGAAMEKAGRFRRRRV